MAKVRQFNDLTRDEMARKTPGDPINGKGPSPNRTVVFANRDHIPTKN